MQGQSFVTYFMELLEQIISFSLLFYKNQDWAPIIPFAEQFDKLQKFFSVRQNLNFLLDTSAGLASIANHDFDWGLKLAFRKALNAPRECSTEHNYLFVGPAEIKHVFYLRFEPHI